jgi:outer membrane protein TolC
MNKRQPIFTVCAVTAIVLTMVVGCSPDFHKADADKEVYKIIDTKWQETFGQKVNYTLSDSNISSPNDVNIDKKLVQTELITLAQAVAVATKYNRDYQRNKEDLYLKALTLTGERYKYALKWFGTFDAEYIHSGKEVTEVEVIPPPAGSPPGTPSTIVRRQKWDSSDDVPAKSQVGVSKTILTPEGILLNTSLVFDWTRLLLTSDPRTTLSSVLSNTLEIPLLGNGAGKVAWENLTQAERDVLYEIRTFNRYRQTFVVDIINAYYGVLRQKDSVTNAKNNWNRSIESRKQLEMEAKTGRSSPYEVDQAKQRELNSYDGYITTLQSYQQSLDLFKVRLTLPVNASLELDQNELMALRDIATGEPNVTVDAAINVALQCRLDLANSYDSIDDAQRKVKLAAEGLGIQLDLIGNSKVNSESDKSIDNFQFHRGTYSVGLSADLPFDRKNQRNIYRRSLIALEQQQREYSNNMDLVMLGVRRAYREYMATAEQYITQKKSLALAEDRVKNMPMLLKSNRARTTDLLDAQNALLLAQNGLTSALIDHTMAKLNFFRDVGILQVKPDGMWTQSVTVSKDQTNEREQSKQSPEDNL